MRVIGLAGWSGAGKTTLLTRLIPCLNGRGVGVSTVKHAHHGLDVDRPGTRSISATRPPRARTTSAPTTVSSV